jgi:hypothetical protein
MTSSLRRVKELRASFVSAHCAYPGAQMYCSRNAKNRVFRIDMFFTSRLKTFFPANLQAELRRERFLYTIASILQVSTEINGVQNLYHDIDGLGIEQIQEIILARNVVPLSRYRKLL